MPLQVVSTVTIDRPIHVVFEAIANPTHMANYFISAGTARLETGKKVTWQWTDVGAELHLLVMDVETDRRIEFTWEATGAETWVEISLKPAEIGTLVTVTEGEWEETPEGVARYGQQTGGWVDMLLCLKAYLLFGVNLRTGEAVGRQ